MHYDRIPKGETAATYLETALVRGRKAAARVKGIKDRDMLLKAKEKDRLKAIRDSIATALKKLHDAYPSFDRMSEFTLQVFNLDMDAGEVKQALGGLQHAIVTIRGITSEHLRQFSKNNALQLRNACIGRISSVMRQTDKHLKTINNARTVFRNLPVVDDTLFTVAIAGFPNVGKSTLLRKLTTATPEVKAYAFTTKGLNVGYFEYRYNRIQCIDTPGTLNRKKSNIVEQKAEIANKYLASLIVYVFDPTESSYPLQDQQALYEEIKKLDKDLLVYVSKTDIADAKAVQPILDKHPQGLVGAEALKKIIIKKFKEWV